MPLQWPTTPKGLPNGRVLPTVATRGLWGATGHQKRRKPPGTRVTGRRGVGEAAEKRRGAWFRFAVSGNWAFCFAAFLWEATSQATLNHQSRYGDNKTPGPYVSQPVKPVRAHRSPGTGATGTGHLVVAMRGISAFP